MPRTIGIGIQDFSKIIKNNYFYIDKTPFIREWWENGDDVTLITRPRRFGKTLTISMLEQFFSIKYAKSSIFQKLSIWKEEKYRHLQGTYPVISLSFANVKESDFISACKKICLLLTDLYSDYTFLLDSTSLSDADKDFFRRVTPDMDAVTAALSIHHLAKYLMLYYGKKALILLDEYDTPMQEAYISGYWEELTSFLRSLFHSTFKTNPWIERAILTGITRVSKESFFSDLNHMTVITTTSSLYGNYFGFTEQEVFAGMDEFGLTEKDIVKHWYDGFIFGTWHDIYNPWSILNYLKEQRFAAYWANTSSNALAGKLIREGNPELKIVMEDLLQDRPLRTVMDEQIVFSQLDHRASAVWSLFLAGGYLKAEQITTDAVTGKTEYMLSLTNLEVRLLFRQLINDWFREYTPAYNYFINAMLCGDLDAMNEYMNRISEEVFSYFDTGKRPSGRSEPERFYHGFVLGLMVDLECQYRITSNRESGFGRYDIMLEPKKDNTDAFLIEFKVYNPRKEHTLGDTVKTALAQIEEKKYEIELRKKGISPERIHKYGFAFEGNHVLIGTNDSQSATI